MGNYVGKLKAGSELMIKRLLDENNKESNDNNSKANEIETKISTLKDSLNEIKSSIHPNTD
jgi:hypothetical protein